ncbi:MAG TPA: choice-of-anchor S family protein [Candidatus Bathyarchaeia archaeon]|nr:choice-of-anchor S family protein [Candidatus Bathyarchaeia archaeon]
MKKAIKLILPLFLIGLIFTTQTIQGEYLVTVDSTFTYDVVASDYNVTFGVNSAEVSGYEIDGHYFDDGTQVILNVTEIDSLGITFNMSAGGYTEEFYDTTIATILEYSLLMLYPIIAIEQIAFEEWNQNDVEDNHLGVLMLPFISVNESTWNDLIQIADNIHTNGDFSYATLVSGITMDATYTNATDYFLFDFLLTANINETVDFMSKEAFLNTTINHKFQFAYSKDSGVMLGMRIKGSISGFSNGTIFDIDYNYHTEREGYDLPAFALGGPTWPFPGFEYLLAIGALTSIVVLIPIIRKRK